jgi:hypothetical protein
MLVRGKERNVHLVNVTRNIVCAFRRRRSRAAVDEDGASGSRFAVAFRATTGGCPAILDAPTPAPVVVSQFDSGGAVGGRGERAIFRPWRSAHPPDHRNESPALHAADQRISKKLDNHEAALAPHFMHYNFARIHKTLGVTPAMEAGVADHVWSLPEMAGLAV